jgi:antirestriction protein ArdC
MRNDIYQRITAQIVAELEKGVRPRMKPWSTERLANRVMRPFGAKV